MAGATPRWLDREKEGRRALSLLARDLTAVPSPHHPCPGPGLVAAGDSICPASI